MPTVYRPITKQNPKHLGVIVGVGTGVVVVGAGLAYLLSRSSSITPPGGGPPGGGNSPNGVSCTNNSDCSSLGPDWVCGSNGYCYEALPGGFGCGNPNNNSNSNGCLSNNGGVNALVPTLLINATSTSGNISFSSSPDSIVLTTVDGNGNIVPNVELLWDYSEADGLFSVSLPSSGGVPQKFVSNSSGAVQIIVNIPTGTNPSAEWYPTWMKTIDSYTGPPNTPFGLGQFYFGSIGLSLIGTDVQAELQVYANVSAIV